MASHRAPSLATLLTSTALICGAWVDAGDIRTLVAGTITVAVTSAAPSGPYDSQAWIRRYYAVDGRVIPSHGPEVILIDLHDLTPGQREESVFVVRDKSTNLLAAVNAFIARTPLRP